MSELQKKNNKLADAIFQLFQYIEGDSTIINEKSSNYQLSKYDDAHSVLNN